MANKETKREVMRQATFVVGYKTPILAERDGGFDILGEIETEKKLSHKGFLSKVKETEIDTEAQTIIAGYPRKIEKKMIVSEKLLKEFYENYGKEITE